MPANASQMNELLYQALETEQGGIKVYEAAIECAVNDDLREEWTEYLEQTRQHERTLRETLRAVGLEPDADTPGRRAAFRVAPRTLSTVSDTRCFPPCQRTSR